jgi:hypothetical protein
LITGASVKTMGNAPEVFPVGAAKVGIPGVLPVVHLDLAGIMLVGPERQRAEIEHHFLVGQFHTPI